MWTSLLEQHYLALMPAIQLTTVSSWENYLIFLCFRFPIYKMRRKIVPIQDYWEGLFHELLQLKCKNTTRKILSFLPTAVSSAPGIRPVTMFSVNICWVNTCKTIRRRADTILFLGVYPKYIFTIINNQYK